MAKAEIELYFQWFVAEIPVRVSELCMAINEFGKIKEWFADYSPGSLDSLGALFFDLVKERPRTAAELKHAMERSGPFLAEVRVTTLTEETISLSVDVGIYLAEVLRENHDQLRWNVKRGSRNNADFGYPVLEGFGGGLALNPVRIGVTLAQGIVKGSKATGRLREIHDEWARRIPSPKHG